MNFSPTILRSRRKTYSIEVHPDGRVVVRVPQRATQAQVEALLKERAGWVERKLANLQAAGDMDRPKAYRAGETFDFLGEACPLQIVAAAARPLELHDGVFSLRRADLPRAAAVFEAWYRAQARAVITGRAEHYAALHGFVYRSIRISGARTRWGSCSRRGGLSFTWRLILAPLAVVDYVVVHELAHLQVPNHSRDFWALVSHLMPDYAGRRRWLKTHGRRLSL